MIALLTKIQKISTWILKNHSGKALIIALIVMMLGVVLIANRVVNRLENQEIRINPEGIKITKRQAEKQEKQAQSQEAEIITEIIYHNEKSDSLYFLLDSIQHRKRSRLDTLQAWYDNYRLQHRRINPD